MDKFNQVWYGAYDEARRFNVSEAVALRHAWATALIWYYYGYTESARPDILSGWRSRQKQRDLLLRWKQGDRAGITAKPASRSWHMRGQAIDVETNVAGFRAYEWFMKQFGMRSGRTFGDLGHFDYPLGPKPRPISV